MRLSPKAKGGRGKKAEVPYYRFSATLPPELGAYLDGLAVATGMPRSEVLAKVLTEYREQQLAAQKQAQKQASRLPEDVPLFDPPIDPLIPPAPPQKKGAEQPKALPKKRPQTAAVPSSNGGSKEGKGRRIIPTVSVMPTEKKETSNTTLGQSTEAIPAELRLVFGALKLAGSTAEYDSYERRWYAGFAGAPATQAQLEMLTKLGYLTREGEGLQAVYRRKP